MALAKVFQIQLTGSKQVEQNAANVRKAFLDMVAQIKAAKQEMDKLLKSGGDSASVAQLKQKIKELEKAQRDLTEQMKINEKQVVANAKAEKLLATAEAARAKAEKEQAAADKIRNADRIQQDKELDRQIALEDKRAKQQERENKYVNALAGSYNQLYGEYKKQRDILAGLKIDKNNEEYAKQFDLVKNLREQVDTFNRSLTKDGTLVGEYTTGITQAFKNMGIDDIIKNQISGGKKELEALKNKTNELVVAYRKAQQEGSADLGKLEKEIHDNVVETEKLKQAIVETEAQLKGVGGIGSQISQGLKENFANLKSSIAQFAIGYFGFQAALSAGNKVIDLNFGFEDASNELQAITGLAGKDLDFIRQKAKEVISFSAEAQLEAVKIIASQKPELLQNAEALNEMKDATILLTQASSKGGGTTEQLNESAKNLTQTMNQFNAPASQATQYVDALAAGAKFGAAEIPQITSALLEFGAQAKSTNVSVQESVGLIELLAEKGLQGADAGTKIRNVLLALNASGALDKQAQQSLRDAGVDIKKLSDSTLPLEVRLKELAKIQNDNVALVRVFGKENVIAGQTILQNVPRYAQLTSQINTVGIAQEQATLNTKGASTAWKELKNQVSNFVTGKVVTGFITFLIGLLSAMLGNLQLTIPLLAIYLATTNTLIGSKIRLAAAWALENAALVIEKAQLITTNAIRATSTLLMNLYTAATIRGAAATGAAAIAYRLLASAIAFVSSPLGIVTALVIGLTTVVGVLAARAGATSKAMSDLAIKTKILNEVNSRAASIVAEQKAQIDSWISVIKSSATSADTKALAVQKLTEIDKRFGDVIKDNVIDLKKLDQAYQDVIASIKLKAAVDASSEISGQKKKELTATSVLRQELETTLGKGGQAVSIFSKDISKEQEDVLNSLKGNGVSANRLLLGGTGFVIQGQDAIKKVIQALKNKETEKAKELDALNTIVAENELKLNESEQKAQQQITNSARQQAENSKLSKQQLEDLIRGVDAEIATLKEGDPKIKELETLKASYQKRLDAINGKNTNPNGSKLTGEQKDIFKDIEAEANRRRQLLEKAKLTSGSIDTFQIDIATGQGKFQKVIIDNEQKYLNELYGINVDAIDKKLALLKNKSNPAERDLYEKLNLEKIQLRKETDEKLFALDNEALERGLKQQEDAAKRQLDIKLSTPGLSETDKLSIQEQFLDQQYQRQVEFNVRQDALEKLYNIKSIKNAEDRKAALQKIQDEIDLVRSKKPEAGFNDQLKEIDDAAAKQQAELRQRVADRTLQIVSSNLSPKQQAEALKKLQEQASSELLASEAARLKLEVDLYKKALDQKLITEKEYQEKLAEYKTAEAALVQNNIEKQLTLIDRLRNALKDFAQTFKENVLGIKQYSKDAEGDQQKVADAISEAQSSIKSAITEAYQGFFQGEKDRIDRQKQDHLDFLDREKQRVLATADSQAERDTIERQFDQKRRAEERKAAEEKKKLALKQLAIDFAVSVIKSIAQYGLPLALIPIGAATIMYAVQRANIQKQQFAGGGKVKPERVGSGLIRTRANIPMQPNGDNVLATVKVGEVVLNEHQQQALGGARVFKAIGVPGFADGGAVAPLGTKLQAPTFNNGFYSSSVNASNDDRLNRLEAMSEEVLKAVYASDSKEVKLVTNKVTEQQEKIRKDKAVAVI